MKVLFLGCGYLGHNLSAILAKDFDVQMLGIISPYTSCTEHFTEVDVFEPSEMKKIDLKDAVVIDTVSLISNSAVADDEQLALAPILNKYKTLFRILKEGGAKRYIFLSSGGTIYGNSLYPIDEGHLLDPKTLYAKSKTAIEEMIQNSALDYLIIRAANPYGGYQLTDKKQGVIPILIEKALKHEPFEMWVNSDSIRDYIYIDDFAKALSLLIEKDISKEIVNLGGGTGTALCRVIELVEEKTGQKIEIHHKCSDVEVIRSIVLSIDKLNALTGFKPTVSLEQGIAKEVIRMTKENER